MAEGASPNDFAGNIRRFSGFADLYDQTRAGPPEALASLLCQYAGQRHPKLVVDLGSGTGLSTRYWADRASRVIGIEPTPDMRVQAISATQQENVSYQDGLSHDTGLPTGCADIVLCMQSLHWMEPAATFAEARRLLRPGGVFATCDYDWPQATGSWEADDAFANCIRLGRQLEQELGLAAQVKYWSKAGHFTRMLQSGCFRSLKDTALHHHDQGNEERLVGLMLSQGYVAALRQHGVTEEQIGLGELRAVARRVLGNTPRRWTWCARVRMGMV